MAIVGTKERNVWLMSVDAHREGTRDVSLRQSAWEAISLSTEEFHLSFWWIIKSFT